MAITRAQQFRQMLKDGTEPVIQGGVENYLGRQPEVQAPRKWQSGPDKPPTELAYITEAEKDLLLKEDIHGSLEDGPNEGPSGIMSLDSYGTIEGGKDVGMSGTATSAAETGSTSSRDVADVQAQLGVTGLPPGVMPEQAKDYQKGFETAQTLSDKGTSFFDKLKTFVPPTQKLLYNILPNNPKTELRYLSRLKNFHPTAYDKLPQNLKARFEETIAYDENRSFKDFDKFSFQDFQDLKNFDSGLDVPGLENFAEYAAKYAGAPGLKFSGNVGGIEKYVTGKDPITGETTYGYRDKRDDDGGGTSDLEARLRLLEQQKAGSGSTDTEQEASTFQPNFRLLAGGGMAERAPYEGGIMDLESARQMYGLGKLVKKVTRSVKKIAKSPIGKVAIGAALFKFGSPLFKSEGLKNFFLKDATKKFAFDNLTTKGVLTGIAGISALGGLTAKEDDEEEQYAGADLPFPVDYYLSGQYAPNMRLAAEGGLMRQNYDEAGAVMSKEDMEKMAKSPLYKGFKTMYSVDPNMARDNKSYKDKFEQFEQLFKKGYQKGGDVEPVAKKTMPLLDMGGMEKDYREEGGFVPIGRMEKADDVPARLSKNEFVFTAEAVRNAGDGDVDLGAEKMYNMMKNLEAGGDVSEESQGLEGARKMFQTSQRLEEVI